MTDNKNKQQQTGGEAAPPAKRARTRPANDSRPANAQRASPPTGGQQPAQQNSGSSTIPPAANFIMKILQPPCGGDQRSDFSAEERAYIDKLPRRDAKRVHALLKSVRPAVATPRRIRTLMSNLPDHVKADIFQQLGENDNNAKYNEWVERALRLPLKKYTSPPDLADRAAFLQRAQAKMDDEIVGHHNAKLEVMRILCSWMNGGASSGFAIGLEGEAGIGKTSFVKRALASAMDRPFCFLSLGGASDASSLLGHGYTYEGAIQGRISEALDKSGVMDPVIFCDELDKISASNKGDEVYNALIHMCDPVQNAHIRDRYLHGIDLDLSRAIFVFSYNDASRVHPILLDRIKRIRMETPTPSQRIDIGMKHLLPRSMATHNIRDDVATDVVEYIVQRHTAEPGMRSVEKDIAHVVASYSLVKMYGAIDVLGLAHCRGCKGDVLDVDFARAVLPPKTTTAFSPTMMYV